MTTAIDSLNENIIKCTRCPRLTEWRAKVSKEKRRSYADWDYWGRPVPNFGDPDPKIIIVGLAPGAHGANRTGRMFTGDESGKWLYRALFEAGLANQPTWEHRNDGLILNGCLITAAAHCAPPANKPTGQELANCREWLTKTFQACPNWRVIVALGKIAFDQIRLAFKELSINTPLNSSSFAHGRIHDLENNTHLLCSYHPSQQNTFTGRLTREMLQEVFAAAVEKSSVKTE